MKVMARLLVLVACGLTVPPPGWCCAVVRWAAPAPKPEPVCCCCCAPEPDSERPPTPPARSWCCERDPLNPSKPVVADAPDASMEFTVFLPITGPGLARRPVVDVVVPDDPLHLLHCVWLC